MRKKSVTNSIYNKAREPVTTWAGGFELTDPQDIYNYEYYSKNSDQPKREFNIKCEPNGDWINVEISDDLGNRRYTEATNWIDVAQLFANFIRSEMDITQRLHDYEYGDNRWRDNPHRI